MPSGNVSSAKPNLAFAKIVATPTPTSWSQVYNAGSLFVVVALNVAATDEEHPLPAIGKTVINNLQSEFFTLEEKTLSTIKEVVEKSVTDIPPKVTLTLSLAYCREATLYLVIYGAGKIVMKRDATVGTLLVATTESSDPLQGASGVLKPEDIVVLMTPQFLEAITEDDLTEALDVRIPNDVAETLTPKVHGSENGGASSLIFSFLGIAPSVFGEELGQESEPSLPGPEPSPFSEEMPHNTEVREEEEALQTPTKSRFSGLHISFPKLPGLLPPLTHTRKLVLTVAIILVVVLIASIYFTKQKQQKAQEKALYQKVYTSANERYKEGTGLLSLDKGRAHDDFLQAEKILKDNITSFPEGSTDKQTLQDLLSQVESNLASTQDLHTVTPQSASDDSAPLLAFEKKQQAVAVSEDSDNFYYLTDTDVHKVTKSGNKDTIAFKNNGDWKNPVSLVVYQGNIYILDQKLGVLKFVAGSDGYGKSTYLQGSVDTSAAASMTIDGDVWLLFRDGTIKQFTKGEADSFSLQGLTTPLKNPTKIYTTRDLTNLYVLDTGNQRIVKVGKDGTYKAQYQAAALGQAKDLTVSETDSTISFLSQGKIWQISINN